MLSRSSHIASRGIVRLLLVLSALLAGSTPSLALKVEQIVSPKGIKAWLVEERAVPLIALRFVFVGGASQDPAGKEGLAGLLADTLSEGAGDLTAEAFRDKLSEQGARLAIASDRDKIYGALETLTKRFGASAELLRLVLTSPRFDPDAVERVKVQRVTDLALSANEPGVIAVERWYQEAFPGHVYARPVNGVRASVEGLTRDDVKAQHRRLFAKDSLRVVIVGDIDQRAAGEALDVIFGSLPEKAELVIVPAVEPRALAAPVVIAKDQPLATAAFGLPSIRGKDPDFPALQVLNHVLGSGDFDSRLMEEIRVKRGLAYSIKTSLLQDMVTTLMFGGFSTKNENMGPALGVLKEVLAATARDGPTPAQFENAKRYLTGSYLLDFDTNSKVAGSLLGFWLDGDGPEYLTERNKRINAVTLADVKRVAEKVLKADRLLVTIVGRPKLGE